jgi:hypothetical protein
MIVKGGEKGGEKIHEYIVYFCVLTPLLRVSSCVSSCVSVSLCTFPPLVSSSGGTSIDGGVYSPAGHCGAICLPAAAPQRSLSAPWGGRAGG